MKYEEKKRYYSKITGKSKKKKSVGIEYILRENY